MPHVMPLLAGLFLLSACAQSIHQVQRETGPLGIPPELEQQVDTSVKFADLQAAPADYVGRVVTVGGIVISAKRTKDQTEMEVLELPTRSDGPSTRDRARSQGRFLAVQAGFLDPATVPPGTPITVIGVVSGSVTKPLDESEYSYPVIDIQHLIDWNTIAEQKSEDRSAAFYGPYYPPYGYWWGPYGYYFPYGGRPFPFVIQPRLAPSPPPPPPQNIPPRFRKR
jgi:outer membrane lipoprotein